MAAYDYRCRTCDGVFEVRRAVRDDATDVRCPDGHRDVARIWTAAAVVGGRSTAERSAAMAPAAAPSGGCCGGGCCG